MGKRAKGRIFFFVLVSMVCLCTISTKADEKTSETVYGEIEKGKASVTLLEADAADEIVIDFFPNRNRDYFLEQFTGYNYVLPGELETGVFVIDNQTGSEYEVVDFQINADMVSLGRIYNDAARASLSQSDAATMDGEAWYQLNAAYYGEANFSNLSVLREMFGVGDNRQGVRIAEETSSKMIALGYQYLFSRSQLSFDNDTNPVSNTVDNAALSVNRYLAMSDSEKQAFLKEIFPKTIGDTPYETTIGYSINQMIGNAYNGAYADFQFTITLRKIETTRIDPTIPTQPTDPQVPSVREEVEAKASTSVLQASAAKAPATGDTHHPEVYGIYLLLGFIALLGVGKAVVTHK